MMSIKKPWGEYKILDEGEGYKVKKLVVNPGAELSLQSHKYRNEYWKIVKGTARVTVGNTINKIYECGESTYVPAGFKHRVGAQGGVLVIIEIQTGSYLGEDDIIRYEDNYGRVK